MYPKITCTAVLRFSLAFMTSLRTLQPGSPNTALSLLQTTAQVSTGSMVPISYRPITMQQQLIIVFKYSRAVYTTLINEMLVCMDTGHAALMGVPRRQPHRRSGLATLPSVGAVP